MCPSECPNKCGQDDCPFLWDLESLLRSIRDNCVENEEKFHKIQEENQESRCSGGKEKEIKDKLKNLHEAAHSLTMAMAEFEDNLVRTNTKMKIQFVNNGDPRLSSDPSGINSNIHPTIESIFLVLRKLLPPPSFAEALNLYREVQSSPNWRQIEASLPNFWLQFDENDDENINKLTNSPASLITSRTEYKYSPVTVSACYAMSGKALLLGWRIFPNTKIRGFEISVDGVLVKRVNSPTQKVALLPDVDPTDEHLVTVNAVPLIPGDSRWIPAKFTYRGTSQSSR